MFKLGKVGVSEVAKQVMLHKPHKYVSLIVKHLDGRFGEVPENVISRNRNSIFNVKGNVLSINEIDGIAFVVFTEIGKHTSISAFYEVQDEMSKKM